MAKKKLKSDGIYFAGEAANDVTGSQYLVKFGDKQILLECGLHQSQSNSYLDSYKINSRKFHFSPAAIDYVFVCHTHIDHCGLLPRLVKEGFHGKIIVTSETAALMKPLLLNSCYIVNEEARILSKRYKRQYQPLYSEEDVYKTLSLIRTYDVRHLVYRLDNTVSFQWFDNSHCLGAVQLQLILKNETKTKKILYTSDIGALHTKNHYVPNTEIPKSFSDVTIMESTYGSSKRENKRTRQRDLEHLHVAVDTVLGRGGSVIMPAFSFSRTQELLTALYLIYGKDANFNYQIVVDSKLTFEISKLYVEILNNDYFDDWGKVWLWRNVRFISEKEASQASLLDDSPRIIISSSGFCTNGRIVNYLKKYLRDPKSMVIFSGFAGDNPSYLSYRIKNYRDHKSISINKEKVPNRADCIVLSTFSSHASHSDLVKYGSSLDTNKLILVHGSEESKKCLSDALNEAICKNDKSYRVVISHRDMIVNL